MEGRCHVDFNSEAIETALDTTRLLDEIEELEARLNLPLSLKLSRSPLVQSLAADAWHLRTSKQSIFSKDPTPPESSCFTKTEAMTSQMHLMAEMRQQARRKLKRISAKERTRIIESVRIYSFDELLRQHIRAVAASRGEYDPDTDSTAEMDDLQKSQTEDERGTKGSASKAEEDDEDEDEEDDDLMRLVRRQREAYTARVAAGRPSIRRGLAAAGSSGTVATSALNSSIVPTPIATAALSKNERLYRSLIRKYIGKAARQRANIRRDKILMARKAARDCAKAVRQRQAQKTSKDFAYRARRLVREISAYWCVRSGGGVGSATVTGSGIGGPHIAGGSDARDVETAAGAAPGAEIESAAAARRRAERALAEQRRADLELLEARRQQRKLNFLLTQTELYSHFMAKTMSGGVAGGDGRVESILERLQEVPKASDETGNAESTLAEAAKAAAGRLGINVDDEFDAEALKVQALSRVQTAIERENQARAEFGQGGQHPMEMEVDISKPPALFKGDLKTYQLKGLAWLLTLFDQGINGILADEMGLGKTVQTIAFLGSLAERYNLWGPFLIVTPASTLHNWTQEFSKFMPDFRLVPYWGSPAERKVLRRFWSPSAACCYGSGLLGTREAAFHVVVTSYQVVLQDAKFINKTAWTYIVLDEAHAIKSTASLRWRLLLSFKCRNRLLLTGTPIQNAMRELWALLHFIMPALFDSHDEFADWFSKDIESQAASGGGGDSTGGGGGAVTTLNENQLSRLRLILKPFMLRRVKAEVEHEITEKTEVLIYCPLTRRQSLLYNRLKSKIRIEDLNANDSFTIRNGGGGGGLQDTNVQQESNRLMNLVMQLRKVCNHPDLFDRRDVRFSCASVRPFEASGANGFWWVPKLLFDEGLVCGQTWRCLPGNIDLGAFEEKMCLIFKHFLLNQSALSFEKGLKEVYQAPERSDAVYTVTADSTAFEVDGECRILPLRQSNVSERVSPTRIRCPEFVYSAFMLPGYVRPLRLYCSQPNILPQLKLAWEQFSPPPAPPSLSLVSPGCLIADSGKLKELDRLLGKLKPEGHRVLIYSQMTKMIDLLEELMLYRGYAYLRLDGSSRLSDRRDMVAQWQTDSRWFVFLLSTRAGGLGINLTAADTVIFYDSDWNPTVDQQAMDRAHRLGQLKPITVYRLISKSTVEGRMLQRAEEKRAMQRMVIAGDSSSANATGDGTDSLIRPDRGDQNKMTQSEMVSLLLDDEELAKRLAQRRRNQPLRGRPPNNKKVDPVVTTDGGETTQAFATPSVDSILSRKRMAAWAERSRGRLKKPRITE
ncbi:dna helicase ino80 [Echinococcus multilocularis]|uniref:Chromatin-remodeling ATPase INO80 n=1 Tax=Echinococcus multilocularis TaxID=6211 RepID=A0A068Y0A7_ECHMU|nr:dna helicase ino80 [Echinococcus multilocularis]